MNKDDFEVLNEDLQQVVLDAADACQIIGLNKTDTENAAALKSLKAMSEVNVIELTGAYQVGFKAGESIVFEASLSDVLSAKELAAVAANDAVTEQLAV